MDSVGGWLGALAFQRRMREALLGIRPSLAARLSADDARPLLKINCGGEDSVVVAAVLAGRRPVWLIADPRPARQDSRWPQGTPMTVLARCAIAHLDSYEAGVPLPSPWCWDEPAPSPLIDVADDLARQGVEVESLIGSNRLFEDLSRPDADVKLAANEGGDWLDAGTDECEIRLGLRPHLGWTLDVRSETVPWRLDLGYLLTGKVSTRPGVRPGDVTTGRIAAVTCAVLEDPQAAISEHRRIIRMDNVVLGYEAPEPTVELRRLGFADVRDHIDERDRLIVSSAEISVHLRPAQPRPVGLPEIQRFAGIALGAGKLPVVFSQAGYTANARRWAAESDVPLFDVGNDRLYAASPYATELLP